MAKVTTANLEEEVYRLGRAIIDAAGRHRPQPWEGEWWYQHLLLLAVEDEPFKAQLLRFIDVFPRLRDPGSVAAHLRDYFGEEGLARFPLRVGTTFATSGMSKGLIPRIVGRSVNAVGRRFIAGRNAQGALPVLKRLHKQGYGFTLDLLGEATLSETEAEAYQRRYLELVDTLGDEVRVWPPNPKLDEAPWGTVPRINISIKLTSLYSQFDPIAPDSTSARVRERLRPILRRAVAADASITIDMEQYEYKDLTLRILRDILTEPEFSAYPHIGIALQAYLYDTERDIHDLALFARQRGAPITIRLVKGAYWDEERIVSGQRGWPIPVFQSKAETDAHFEACVDLLLDSYPHLRPAIGSHNVRSIACTIAAARQRGLPTEALEFQMLYGMAEGLQASVAAGHRLRVYVPIGELIPGMAYLVRRLLENASNESWLFNFMAEYEAATDLLAPPKVAAPEAPAPVFLPYTRPKETPQPFRNAPDTPFFRGAEREAMRAALDRQRHHFPETCGPVIKGERVRTERLGQSLNPANPSEVVAHVYSTDIPLAEKAVAIAKAAFPGWRDRSFRQRAQVLFDATAIMRRERTHLAALEILETAKPWREADADVAEAIDYLEYYGREAVALDGRSPIISLPGERNDYVYQPRGVALVISPWNFPLAIPAGMTAAALVAGNSVILKPAEPSPLVAARLIDILHRAGAPPGALQFLPGKGSTVGAHLVEHPEVDIIAFTGSRQVGLGIVEAAGRTKPGQRNVKRVIAEMGGKNAIIVDDDADLDQAVLGIMRSAFGYAGQKCSACSRVITIGRIYDDLAARLIEAVRSIRVGPPEDPANFLPPVITAQAKAGIESYIEIGQKEARLLFQGQVPQDGGYYVPPTIFGDVQPDAVIAQEEIFGPVLALMRAESLDEAVEIALATPYGLTGGFYSRSPSHIEHVKERFRVGNLYINRGITGAMVGRQPFGGFGTSGIGSKAGGPDYLRQFLEPRTITENLLRRGFAPRRGSPKPSGGDAG